MLEPLNLYDTLHAVRMSSVNEISKAENLPFLFV